MIKIGTCYFNEDLIAAIEPAPSGKRATVYFAQGLQSTVDITEAELERLLEKAGLLPSGGPPRFLSFQDDEQTQLIAALGDGWLYAAKDKSGQVYAYRSRPEKGTDEWSDACGPVPRRLFGEFECLSFEDDDPLDLAAFFGDDEEDE